MRLGTPDIEQRRFRFLEWWAGHLVDDAVDQEQLWRFGFHVVAHDGNFSFAGRTTKSVMALVRDTYRCDGDRARAARVGALPSSGLPGGRFVLFRERREERVWQFEEIASGARLADEGRRMRHCVAGHVDVIQEKSTAIFSVALFEWGRARRGFTLEIDRKAREVVQAKGFANRSLDDDERAVLAAWADTAQLRVNL